MKIGYIKRRKGSNGGFHMTCMEAQSLITPFFNNKLDVVTLEKFLEHIETCKECREELSVYFTILTAMKQLDDDKELSEDFEKELECKIKKAQEFIIKKKIIHIRKRFLFAALIVLSGCLVGVSINVVDDAKNKSEIEIMDKFYFENEVMIPYMNHSLINHLMTYEQLNYEIEEYHKKIMIEKDMKEYKNGIIDYEGEKLNE